MVTVNLSMLRIKQAQLKFFKDKLSIPKNLSFLF